MNDHLIDDAHLTKSREMFAKCKEVVSGGESSYAGASATGP